MQEFIVTTDLYEASDATVYTSYHLAQALDLRPKLYFVDGLSPMIEKTFHPQKIHTTYALDPVWNKKYEVTVLEKIASQLERISLKKESFDFEVFEGSVSAAIKHLKRQHQDIGLISIGASEHGEISRLFFNTFAEKVFFNLNKESLIVKKKDKEFSKICMLIDPISHQDESVVKVVNLLKQLRQKLHIICLVDVQFLGLNLEAFPHAPGALEIQKKTIESLRQKAQQVVKELEIKLKIVGVECQHEIHVALNKDNALALDKMLHKIDPNLVIMSPHSQLLHHFGLGSITHYLLKHNNYNFYLLP
ncbi:MAG: universal stress protein [Bdellovibrio sp.]|nr:universal stress protein [Bdellovibrio sp.]